MSNVVKIGRPPTFGKAVRLMTADEASAANADEIALQKAALRSGAKWQATRLFERVVVALGEDEARKVMLEVAKALFKE